MISIEAEMLETDPITATSIAHLFKTLPYQIYIQQNHQCCKADGPKGKYDPDWTANISSPFNGFWKEDTQEKTVIVSLILFLDFRHQNYQVEFSVLISDITNFVVPYISKASSTLLRKSV